MPNFNPSSPTIEGAEWYGSRQRVIAVGPGIGGGALQRAATTESIVGIQSILRTPAGSAAPAIFCDVYDTASPLADGVRMIQLRPTANKADWQTVSQNAGWRMRGSDFAGSPSAPYTAYDPYALNAYQHVDELVYAHYDLAADPADTWRSQLLFNATDATTPNAARVEFTAGGAGYFDGNDGSGGVSFNGTNGIPVRIRSVEVIATVRNETSQAVLLDGILTINGIRITDTDGGFLLPANSQITRHVFRFAYNAAQGGIPWYRSTIAGLLAGTDSFGLGISHKGQTGLLHVGTVGLQFRVCNERRVAIGFATGVPGAADTWVDFTMLNPADGSTRAFTKTAGHEYYACYSAIRGPVSILGVDSLGTAGGTALTGSQLGTSSLDDRALLAPGSDSDVGSIVRDNAVIHTVWNTSSGPSLDSTVYATVSGVKLGKDGWPALTQGLTGSATYGTVGILVQTDGRQNAPLTVKLRRGGTLLGTANINVGDVPSDGLAHVKWVVLDGSATFDGSETIEISSTSTFGWIVPCLLGTGNGMSLTDADSAAASVAGIGGSADAASIAVSADFPWSVAAPPTTGGGGSVGESETPGNLSAAVAFMTLSPVPPGGISRIYYAHITWGATTLDTAFDHYELQRQDDGVWYPIAYIEDEASSYFNDVECQRGVAVSYRVRAITTGGVPSDWSD
jgi:hypothetical protein